MNTETAITATRTTMYLNHLKNNRIEYLVVGLICHSLGLFDKLTTHTQGVCL